MAAVIQLSREADRWTAASDRRLEKFVEYLSHTRAWELDCTFKRNLMPTELERRIYCDADHAG